MISDADKARRRHTERVVALVSELVGVTLRRPVRVTDHAFVRWTERWGRSRAELLARLPRFELVSYERREQAATWEHEGVRIVVLCDGTVKTVLPPGATRKNRRPEKGTRRQRERFREQE